MQSTKTLPETYSMAWAVDLKKDTRLNWTLQIVGMFWFLIAGWLLWKIVTFLRPDYVPGTQLSMSFLLLGGIILVILITLILHELVHGLFFWLFTGERPQFGIGPGYAYAAAPDWYFPKGKYLVIGLSPLVVLTVLGLAVILFVPTAWLGILFWQLFSTPGAQWATCISVFVSGWKRQMSGSKTKATGSRSTGRDETDPSQLF
jgi:hypothetical protein